jgi:hypothetical protein
MRLGKFEGNTDQQLAEYLYDLLGESYEYNNLGDASTFGFYALFLNVAGIGKMKSYIVHEDSQGFFSYTIYHTKQSALEAWGNLESEYADFEREAE